MEFLLTVFLMGIVGSATGSLDFRRNECPNYIGYFYRYINNDCYYNNEHFLQTPQILSLRNIPYENHTVVTEDGYILSMFRVTQSNPKGVIVLLHPIIQDSTNWFLGRNNSYVTTFMNAGYELWLVNWRGVTYSDKHVRKLTTLEYWDFSFHEIGVYDYSAVFRHINNVTNSKVIAFSMSIGSAAATIYASEKPEEAQRLVKLFIAMAVPAFMQESYSIVRVLVPFVPIVKALQRIFRFDGLFYGIRPIAQFVERVLLAINFEWFCALVIPPFVGGVPSEIDPGNIPMGVTITPEPISFKSLYHFGQLMTNGNQFVQYDYGKEKNLQRYNSEKPPRYPVEKINVPFYIVLGDRDNLANKNGNLLLYSKLSEAAKVYGYLEVPKCSHADFLIGKQAPFIIQNHTLTLMASL